MRRRFAARALGLAAAFGLLILPWATVSASAATTPSGYPPTTTTTSPQPTTGLNDYLTGANAIAINTTEGVDGCLFLPFSAVTMTFNGSAQPDQPVNSEGCVPLSIQAFDPHVRINGGALLPANWVGNTIVLHGTGYNHAARTYTVVFDIAQPGQNGGGNSVSSSSSSGGSSGSSSSSSSSNLAFTGADIAAMVVGALALLALGSLVVILTRSRRAATSQRQ